MSEALVVLSGGQDSATCLALAIEKHGAENVHAVTFFYGQRHEREVLLAQVLCSKYLPAGHHRLVNLSFLGEITTTSALAGKPRLRGQTQHHIAIDDAGFGVTEIHMDREPTEQEVAELAEAMRQSEVDPSGSIVVNPALQVSVSDEIDHNAQKMMAGLGVDQSMLEGDTSYATSGVGNQPSSFDAALPNSFVPGRNLLFLSVAASMAANMGIQEVWTGICQTDYSGYPDCRNDFKKKLNEAINLAFGVPYEYVACNECVDPSGQVLSVKSGSNGIVLIAPLMWLDKAQTVELAFKTPLGREMLRHTHTCYNGVWPPCGDCPACTIRHNGFVQAGEFDPLYESYERQPSVVHEDPLVAYDMFMAASFRNDLGLANAMVSPAALMARKARILADNNEEARPWGDEGDPDPEREAAAQQSINETGHQGDI